MTFRVLFTILLVALLTLLPGKSVAGVFEFSLGFGFNRSKYTEDDFSWRRRYTASLGYHFTSLSGIELSYQNITERTLITSYQDTTFKDQVYSLSWVQALLEKQHRFQPFFKIGIGQLNRDAVGEYAGGGVPPAQVDSVTAVGAVGLRAFFSQQFALRMEATTYLTGGSVRTWKDNIAINLGVSLFY